VIPGNLPDYVERGGRQVWRPPYTADGADLYGFVVQADPAAIDLLLDRDLVEPARGAVDYRCAQPRIVVVFASIAALASDDSRDSQRGYLSELEVSVWCLAAEVSAENRLVWYLPYVFVDSGQASASGREVYGYPKQVASFDAGFPDVLANGGTTEVKGLAIDPYSPGTRAVPRAMISAQRDASLPGSQAVRRSGADPFEDLLATLSGSLDVNADIPYGPGPPASAVITPVGAPPPARSRPRQPPPWLQRRPLGALSGRGLLGARAELIREMVSNPTLVFLKQCRDVTCPTKACYQAIVEAQLAVDPLGATYEELDEELFAVRFADWDSHPIASEVGVAAETWLRPEVAFHATLDFDIRLGLEVWRAPT
jgi:hypothetical protein